MPATISGTYQLPDGSPSSGQVRFRLMPAILDLTGNQITQQTVEAALDAAGSFTVDLMAEGELEAGLVADGPIAYKVVEDVDGLRRTWDLYVPDTQAINLPERYPGDALAGTSAVLPVPGPATPMPLGFHVSGVVNAGTVSAEFFTPVAGTLTLIYGVTSQGTVDVRATVNGTPVGGTLAVSSSAASLDLGGQAVVSGDRVGLVTSNPTASPQDLSVTITLAQ